MSPHIPKLLNQLIPIILITNSLTVFSSEKRPREDDCGFLEEAPPIKKQRFTDDLKIKNDIMYCFNKAQNSSCVNDWNIYHQLINQHINSLNLSCFDFQEQQSIRLKAAQDGNLTIIKKFLKPLLLQPENEYNTTLNPAETTEGKILFKAVEYEQTHIVHYFIEQAFIYPKIAKLFSEETISTLQEKMPAALHINLAEFLANSINYHTKTANDNTDYLILDTILNSIEQIPLMHAIAENTYSLHQTTLTPDLLTSIVSKKNVNTLDILGALLCKITLEKQTIENLYSDFNNNENAIILRMQFCNMDSHHMQLLDFINCYILAGGTSCHNTISVFEDYITSPHYIFSELEYCKHIFKDIKKRELATITNRIENPIFIKTIQILAYNLAQNRELETKELLTKLKKICNIDSFNYIVKNALVTLPHISPGMLAVVLSNLEHTSINTLQEWVKNHYTLDKNLTIRYCRRAQNIQSLLQNTKKQFTHTFFGNHIKKIQ